MELTTLQRVKSFDSPGTPDNRDDFKIQTIITAISKKIEKFLGRDLLYTKRTEKFPIQKFQKPWIWLAGYPVETGNDALPARAATQQDVDEGYAVNVGDNIPATPNTLEFYNLGRLLDSSEVELQSNKGLVNLTQYTQLEGSNNFSQGSSMVDGIEWGSEALEVVYWGGLARTTQEFIEEYPDIEYEVIQQVLFDYKRSRNLTQISVGAGGNSAEIYVPFTLRDELKRSLRPYRKIARV